MYIITGVWRDANTGKLAETTVRADEDAGGRAIIDALQDKSNVLNVGQQVGQDYPGAMAPAGGSYHISVADRAMLFFAASDGSTVPIVLPAPDESIFLGDGETVDISKITAIITAVTDHGLAPSGAVIVGYSFGNLVKLVPRLQ